MIFLWKFAFYFSLVESYIEFLFAYHEDSPLNEGIEKI